MAEKNAIYKFAIKWCDKFSDVKNSKIDLIGHCMADDCEALGFEMDCGVAFEQHFNNAISDYRALDQIIDDVYDIQLLGSAIYSRWHYFNHLSYNGAEILEPSNRSWFILALSRLAYLTDENPFLFQGTLQEISIVSNRTYDGLSLAPEDEVEQHITIYADGRGKFSSYRFGDIPGQYEEANTCDFEIDKAIADQIFKVFLSYFSSGHTQVIANDTGTWKTVLTNTKGRIFRFHGCFCAGPCYKGADLSELIRNSLSMTNLYVFDGHSNPDEIIRISIEYHRITKIRPKDRPDNALSPNVVIWDYSEQLILDGTTETLEHIAHIGTGCHVSHKYEVEEGISSLLESFDADRLFRHIEGNPEDVIENPDESRVYTINIDYKNSPRRSIHGSFDKKGLPSDFDEFIDAVYQFIHFYGIGELFDPSVYGKQKRLKTDYIFCSVEFDSGYKSYYYITDDDSIEVGDFVIVPAGKDNHPAAVEVVKKEYFSEEDAPFPIEKTKRIIRKCTDEEFAFPEGAEGDE